ncbi:ABC transporter ATP-binding protein [Pendulispora albinea]|uniref:ABC transporter ATP-binding protein/permease n=1 Tax=Pendulispora albinea TaxID=2741071 RepID=A0ABZ2M2C1_9BACT
MASAVLPLGIAYVGKRIVDAVVARDSGGAWRWVAAELLLVAALTGATQALSLVRRIVGARLGLDINVAILEKATALELRYFEDSEFYDRLNKARREASSRPLSVIARSFQILQSIVSLLGYAALLLRFSGWAVAALLLAAIPATVAEMRFSSQAFRLRNWRSPESRKLLYLEHVLSNDEHAKEVKLFGLGEHLLARYRDIGELFYREDSALAVRAAKWAYALSLLATLTFYGCYATMALSAARGALSLGDLTLGMVAFRQGQQAFQSLLGAFGGMVEDNLYMSNLFGYLAVTPPSAQARAAEPALADAPAPAALANAANAALAPALKSPPGIRFEDVGFRYPGRDEWALRHIDVFIPQGESLAIVGQNGAGKTTFIKLLTRLYEPTEGRIWLDGRDLRDWDEALLRRRIGVVFQDFAQYQFTARENVGLGSVDDLGDTAQIGRAISKGGAEEVVSALKEGLETPLGRWFRDGVELSGGQWQKIALSRAFMREGADILVLDEPTAALDAVAEHAVFERFRELTRDKTSILISHRFPTVRMADRILVIEHGRVVEQGTHASLVEQNGRYAHLFALQAQGYL